MESSDMVGLSKHGCERREDIRGRAIQTRTPIRPLTSKATISKRRHPASSRHVNPPDNVRYDEEPDEGSIFFESSGNTQRVRRSIQNVPNSPVLLSEDESGRS